LVNIITMAQFVRILVKSQMEIRKLSAARGWTWVKQGYQLIMINPLMSITFALIGSLVFFAAFSIPPFGPLLAMLMMPTALVGYMRVCRALEEEEKVSFSQLVAGFQKHTARLLTLGGLLLLGMFISALVVLSLGGEELRTLIEKFQPVNDPQMVVKAIQGAGSNVAFSFAVGSVLMSVLVLVFQYAPMLVFFNEVPPITALRASLYGFIFNFIPYAVFSCIMLVVALVLGILPFGIGLIAFLPLSLTSLYVSYRNIFPFAHELAAIETVSQ
jgi:uncharacterized membrane protein